MHAGTRKAQTLIEYAIFVAVIVAALVAMSPYIRRALQANLKGLEDQINAEACSKPGDTCDQ